MDDRSPEELEHDAKLKNDAAKELEAVARIDENEGRPISGLGKQQEAKALRDEAQTL